MRSTGSTSNNGAFLLAAVVAIATLGSIAYRSLINRSEAPVDIAKAIAAGNLPAARSALEAICENEPQNTNAIHLLSDVCQKMGDTESAISWLESLQPSDKSRQTLMKIAGLCLAEGLPGRALSHLHEALRTDPLFSPARQLIIRIHALLLDQPGIRRNVSELDQAELATIDDIFLYYPGSGIKWEDNTHVDWLRKSFRNEPDNLQLIATMIRVLPRFEETSEASDLVETYSAHTDKCWQLAYAVAMWEFERRNFVDALHILQDTEKECEQSEDVWLLRGRIFRQLRMPDVAVRCLKNAAALDPTSPAPLAELRQIDQTYASVEKLVQLEQYADIRDSFRSGNRLSPADVSHLVSIFSALKLHRAEFITAKQLADSSSRQHTTEPLSPATLDNINLPQLLSGLDPEQAITRDNSHKAAAIHFEDVTKSVGLDFTYDMPGPVDNVLLTSLGGGVAILDYDNDLWPDLYLSQGQRSIDTGQMADFDQLIRNRHGTCAPATTAATITESGFSHGVCTGDFNNDGFVDVFVCNYGTNTLLQNNGDGTFFDATPGLPQSSRGWSTSAVFSDLDQDGDTDLYIARYVTATYRQQMECAAGTTRGCRPNDFDAQTDLLYENNGNGLFIDRSETLAKFKGKGLGVTTLDYDNDGWTDIFVGNDTTHNFLFHNVSATSDEIAFEETAMSIGVGIGLNGYSQACMGVAVADVDHNGYPDILVTNYEFEPNSLYMNFDGIFHERGELYGLSGPSWNRLGWGAQLFDANNDSYDDLIVLNSHLYGHPMPTDIFVNKNGTTFVNSKDSTTELNEGTMGRASAVVDWNLDGRPDFIATGIGGRAQMFLNRSICPPASLIRLVGTKCSRDAREVAVIAESKLRGKFRLHGVGDAGYMSTNGRDITVPPGHKAEVVWPGRVRTEVVFDHKLPVELIVQPRTFGQDTN